MSVTHFSHSHHFGSPFHAAHTHHHTHLAAPQLAAILRWLHPSHQRRHLPQDQGCRHVRLRPLPPCPRRFYHSKACAGRPIVTPVGLTATCPNPGGSGLRSCCTDHHFSHPHRSARCCLCGTADQLGGAFCGFGRLGRVGINDSTYSNAFTTLFHFV